MLTSPNPVLLDESNRAAHDLPAPAQDGVAAHIDYRGHRILLARSRHGWSACVATLAIESMFCDDAETAAAAGKAIVDGMIAADWPARKMN
jgi:hypothetical protein